MSKPSKSLNGEVMKLAKWPTRSCFHSLGRWFVTDFYSARDNVCTQKAVYLIFKKIEKTKTGSNQHQRNLAQHIVIKGFFTISTNLFLVSADGILIGHKEQ